METDKRLIQTADVGLLAGILLRTSNTAEAFAREIESLKGLLQERDKTIKELSEKCKRLIDEKNGHGLVETAIDIAAPGNGVAAS